MDINSYVEVQRWELTILACTPQVRMAMKHTTPKAIRPRHVATPSADVSRWTHLWLREFIAQGDRSEYVVQTLRDVEMYVRAEKVTVDQLLAQAAEPLRLRSIAEISALALSWMHGSTRTR